MRVANCRIHTGNVFVKTSVSWEIEVVPVFEQDGEQSHWSELQRKMFRQLIEESAADNVLKLSSMSNEEIIVVEFETQATDYYLIIGNSFRSVSTLLESWKNNWAVSRMEERQLQQYADQYWNSQTQAQTQTEIKI